MLYRAPILVVEDEPFIALDLALSIEDAGGDVVGPASSVREALGLIESRVIAGAIFDVNLSDRDITPVVEILIARHIPFILQTGAGLPSDLQRRFPDLVVFSKPTMTAMIVAELEAMLGTTAARATAVG